MATLGIYGVVSYFVRQRTVELGTRMALGAVNRDLVALVLGGGLKLSLAGLAVGSVALVGGVWLLVRVLEVADIGWLPFAASAAVVALVAAAAASVPAWRTTLLSPMAAMREQPPSVWRWARQRMERAARDVREAVVGADDSGSDVSAGRRADRFRRRRAQRRLVHAALCVPCSPACATSCASNRPRCSSGVTARRRTTAASPPWARSKRPRRSCPPTDF